VIWDDKGLAKRLVLFEVGVWLKSRHIPSIGIFKKALDSQPGYPWFPCYKMCRARLLKHEYNLNVYSSITT
jgi:hypothetical protein